jgi:hypothetical protein
VRRPVESALEDVLEIVDYASAREQRAITEELHREQTGGQFWMSISNGWHRMLFGQDLAPDNGENTKRVSWLIPLLTSFVCVASAFYLISIGIDRKRLPSSNLPSQATELFGSRWLVVLRDRTTLNPIETAYVAAYVSGDEEMSPSDRLMVEPVASGHFEVLYPSWLRQRSGEQFKWISLYVDAGEAYEPFERRYPLKQEVIEVYLDKKELTTVPREQKRKKKRQR